MVSDIKGPGSGSPSAIAGSVRKAGSQAAGAAGAGQPLKDTVSMTDLA
ncbi:MAG: hypothetical protein ACU85V_09425, partial [Gammaproteobacteria bacterium]